MAQPVKEVIFPDSNGEKNVGTGNILDWVAPEYRNIMSQFVHDSSNAFNIVEEKEDDAPASWSVRIPLESWRIFSAFPGTHFPMYEFAFKEAGMCLPFINF